MRLCLPGACRHIAASPSCQLEGHQISAQFLLQHQLPQQVGSGQAVCDAAFKSEPALLDSPIEPDRQVNQTDQGVPIMDDALPLNSLLRLHGDPQALVQAA